MFLGVLLKTFVLLGRKGGGREGRLGVVTRGVVTIAVTSSKQISLIISLLSFFFFSYKENIMDTVFSLFHNLLFVIVIPLYRRNLGAGFLMVSIVSITFFTGVWITIT